MLIVLLVLLLLLIILVSLSKEGSTPAIRDANNNSIAILESVVLNDLEQWILIRGNDKDNPVLLWLHGGPGSAQMPISHALDKELEKEFIVVHWDQRGAGKSNPKDFDASSMVYENFISDAHDLTQYLKESLGKDKIFILGHSWGTQIGLELVFRYPEDYHAYIGVSQVVNQELGQSIAYAWLLEQMQRQQKSRDLQKLEEVGPPPYKEHKRFLSFIRLVDRYKGSFDVNYFTLVRMALGSTEYSKKELLSYLRGSNRGSGQMWDEKEYSDFDAIKDFASLHIPIYFFQGKNDYNTVLEAVKQYYQELDAPKGKQLIIFETSAHTPFLAEPEKFNRELISIKKEILTTFYE